MEEVFREIRNIRKVSGDFYFHDPFYDNGKRQFMRFARPVVNTTSQWDSVTDQWEILEIFDNDSVHRPSEFYDFYIDPKLVNDKIISEYKEILFKESHQYKIIKIMEKDNIDYFEAMMSYIYKVKYKVMHTLPHYRVSSLFNYMFPGIPFTFSTQFSETWNTADYSSLLLPKRQIHFVNIEKLECNCYEFKEESTCDHIIIPSIKRIIWDKFGNHDLIEYFKPTRASNLELIGHALY